MYRDIENDETSLPKWVAAEDAQRKSTENRKLYSEDEQRFVQELLSKVSGAYSARVFANYREKFAAVKVMKPTVRDRVSSAVKEVEAWAAKHGIERVTTGTAVIYRVKH